MKAILSLGVFAFVGLLLSSCGERITQVAIIDSPTALGPNWSEITLSRLVIAKWNAQVLRVTVTTKFEESTDPWGLKLEDGSIVVPGLVLITDGRAKYGLHFDGFAQSNVVELRFSNDSIPKGTHFMQLRMRCLKPIVLSRIEWFSYMPQDTKTGEL